MTGGSANWRLGFTLSLTTAALWGLLPIALKVVLEGMDAYTIVWWRFAVAAAGLALAAGGNADIQILQRV